MQHTALYRKYRPQDFDSVRGQVPIITALKGAIQKKQIPHALLFSGPRGTGKTSVARIFARAIGAQDIDVYEIDAASNRGIDDVRMLREAVLTLPYESPYKVYIIDEVHMLTKEAFNALLKTLEEPPEHVVFILATTEVDRLLPTIVSRCQVYRFQAPTRETLRDAVSSVASSEGFTLSVDGADLIALAADGSFRDALGITQKVITASLDTRANADEVATIIGAPKTALLVDVLEGIQNKYMPRALRAVRAAATQSVDMRLFARLLLERMRTIILIRNVPTDSKELLELYAPEDRELLARIAATPNNPIHSKTLLLFLDAADRIPRVSIAHLPLELAIIESLS